MKKTIVLLSGGLDSSVAAAYMHSKKRKVFPLYINHGQPWLTQERKAMQDCVKTLSLQKPIETAADLQTIKKQSSYWKTLNIGDPARNQVFLSMGVMYAGVIGADEVVLGAPAGFAYPDNSILFLEHVSEAGKAALDRDLLVFSPFKQEKWTESDVLVEGRTLGVPLNRTWSCHEPSNNLQCGKCRKCKGRKSRFERANIHDTTVYAKL